MRSAPTNSTISPWMMSVRLDASSGGKISGSRFRVDVPVCERGEEERGEADADGGVPAEQRDGDADEPDRRALDVGDVETELPAEDVERAREPGERPRRSPSRGSSCARR